MGVSHSPDELALKFQRAARAISEGRRETLALAAQTVKDRILDRARPVSGGDLRLSGTKNKRVGVRYKLSADQVDVRAIGPMHWLERGTKPHAVAPKSLGGSRAARSAFVAQAFGSGTRSLSFGKKTGALRFEVGGRTVFTKYARKAGKWDAQHVWSDGVDDSRRPVRNIFSTQTAAQVARVFG